LAAATVAEDVTRAPESEGSASGTSIPAGESAGTEVATGVTEPATASAAGTVSVEDPVAEPTPAETTSGTADADTVANESPVEGAATLQPQNRAEVAESPSETLALDTAYAPESEGSAATVVPAVPAETSAETPDAAEVAADPTLAPESDGSADAQP
jgi:hypothetical protein